MKREDMEYISKEFPKVILDDAMTVRSYSKGVSKLLKSITDIEALAKEKEFVKSSLILGILSEIEKE